MNRKRLVMAAYLLDCVVGDPESLPHPVRLFGRCIHIAEKRLLHPVMSPRAKFAAGCVLAVGLPTAVAYLVSNILRRGERLHRPMTLIAEVQLAASCLATHNLLKEAASVVAALEQDDIATARARVARIVGRDTQDLDAAGVSRAVIETLAESLCDGIIAPLFYLTLGGVPAALAYKAINTMDSMIGHTSERYWHFGKAAARIDDAANFLPARASALLLCAASAIPATQASPQGAWKTWLEDGDKHASPNAGQMESAMAGALQVRLGGSNSYDGQPIHGPEIGAAYRPPQAADARRALKLTGIASLLGFAVALCCLSRKR